MFPGRRNAVGEGSNARKAAGILRNDGPVGGQHDPVLLHPLRAHAHVFIARAHVLQEHVQFATGGHDHWLLKSLTSWGPVDFDAQFCIRVLESCEYMTPWLEAELQNATRARGTAQLSIDLNRNTLKWRSTARRYSYDVHKLAPDDVWSGYAVGRDGEHRRAFVVYLDEALRARDRQPGVAICGIRALQCYCALVKVDRQYRGGRVVDGCPCLRQLILGDRHKHQLVGRGMPSRLLWRRPTLARFRAGAGPRRLGSTLRAGKEGAAAGELRASQARAGKQVLRSLGCPRLRARQAVEYQAAVQYVEPLGAAQHIALLRTALRHYLPVPLLPGDQAGEVLLQGVRADQVAALLLRPVLREPHHVRGRLGHGRGVEEGRGEDVGAARHREELPHDVPLTPLGCGDDQRHALSPWAITKV
mmetsp:Transcript_99916/g.282784  ORF Transcript_99916/g.282784 Transcript_99916/m.282784 type:complete len:417 (-) Transcript_99916:451-1701(-)